jgi:hypothetical protein
VLRAGEQADIEPGVWHDWWNEGDVDAIVRVEITPGERSPTWSKRCSGSPVRDT